MQLSRRAAQHIVLKYKSVYQRFVLGFLRTSQILNSIVKGTATIDVQVCTDGVCRCVRAGHSGLYIRPHTCVGFYSCLSLLYWACEGLEERRLATITEIHAFFVLYLPEVRDFGIGNVRTSLPTYRIIQNPNLLLGKRQSTKSHRYSLMPTAKCTCRPWTTTAWTCWSFHPKTLTTCCHFPRK